MRGILWILVLYAWVGLAALLVFVVCKAGQGVGRWVGRRTRDRPGGLRG